jgi:hypothetical protein
MQKLAESFAAQWYPTLTGASLAIKWPAQYLSYAQAHPPKYHAPRHRKVTAVTAKEDDRSDDEDESDDDDGDGGGYSTPEGDDADVSPYR